MVGVLGLYADEVYLLLQHLRISRRRNFIGYLLHDEKPIGASGFSFTLKKTLGVGLLQPSVVSRGVQGTFSSGSLLTTPHCLQPTVVLPFLPVCHPSPAISVDAACFYTLGRAANVVGPCPQTLWLCSSSTAQQSRNSNFDSFRESNSVEQ